MKTFKLILFRFFVPVFCFMTGISAYAYVTININTDSGVGNGSGFTFAHGVLTIEENGNYQIIGNGTQTGNYIVVNDGVTATITLENVNIVSSVYAFYIGSVFITPIGANVTLLLKGSNTLISNNDYAGIYVHPLSLLTIDSKENPGSKTGELIATGGEYGAGIGGKRNVTSGTIIINGGTITANGGHWGAGIGGGEYGNGGAITINGGIVTATVVANADFPACIGGGAYGDAGIITITGGAVVAKGGLGGSIGRGGPNGAASSGSITISGGSVFATGYGIGMSGHQGVTASIVPVITGNAMVFANTINGVSNNPLFS